jgi:preprotein translocase subunit SecA
MITKSIERAQKKVEENNFGIRKRLLEYDDVMNSQREVIYERRRNALFGERLQLDLMNMMFDTCEDIVIKTRNSEDYDGFKLNVITTLGIDFKIGREEFLKVKQDELVQNLYHESQQHYREKSKLISQKAINIFREIHKNKGATVKEVLVPFTDGKKQIGVATNLEKNIETNCRELINSLEKFATLSIIDQAWKEHLREMDDLKQSVQNAVYEQKDPLLIYKFEAFQLFKQFVAKVNEDTMSFITKAEIPVRDPEEVKEAVNRRRSRESYKTSKEESRSLLSGGGSPEGRPRQPVERHMPVKSEKTYGRNDRVTVQYVDGNVKKDVKYKNVEEDINSNRCVVLEES